MRVLPDSFSMRVPDVALFSKYVYGSFMNIAEAVASNLRRLRSARGLTTQALERRLIQIGHRIARSSLTNMELGRREASLDDIAALAAALDVPPLLLIAPVASEPTVTVLGTEMDSWQFAQWFAGRAPLRGADATEDDRNSFAQGAVAINLRIEHDAKMKTYRDALEFQEYSKSELWPLPGDEEVAPSPHQIAEKVRNAATSLILTRSIMRQHGLPLPSLPPEMAHLDDRRFERHTTEDGVYFVQTPAPRS